MFKRTFPYEWWGLICLVVAYDIFVHRTKKRATLSNVIKSLNQDNLSSSILWAFWGWLTYHWFFERDN